MAQPHQEFGALELPGWKTALSWVAAALLALLFLVSGLWKITDVQGAAPTVGPGALANTAVGNYVKALSKGVLKVMSKMGISTIASYTGAQVFEAFGLAQPLVDEYFGGTPSRLGGVGLTVLAEEAAARHATA